MRILKLKDTKYLALRSLTTVCRASLNLYFCWTRQTIKSSQKILTSSSGLLPPPVLSWNHRWSTFHFKPFIQAGTTLAVGSIGCPPCLQLLDSRHRTPAPGTKSDAPPWIAGRGYPMLLSTAPLPGCGRCWILLSVSTNHWQGALRITEKKKKLILILSPLLLLPWTPPQPWARLGTLVSTPTTPPQELLSRPRHTHMGTSLCSEVASPDHPSRHPLTREPLRLQMNSPWSPSSGKCVERWKKG